MGDYTIRARFDAKATPSDVSRWLDDTKGIAGWWSDNVQGSASSPGDEFTVRFPDTEVPFVLKVTESADGVVEWQVPDSPPWWEGTSIRFEVSESADGSNLMFSHAGFDPDDPIIPVITPAWVRFLDNLVAVAESGEASPAVVN
jgi:hypothetical protein